MLPWKLSGARSNVRLWSRALPGPRTKFGVNSSRLSEAVQKIRLFGLVRITWVWCGLARVRAEKYPGLAGARPSLPARWPTGAFFLASPRKVTQIWSDLVRFTPMLERVRGRKCYNALQSVTRCLPSQAGHN